MSERPNWRKGDVIITVVPGRGPIPFVAEHEPMARGESFWKKHEWCYGNANAAEFRLATHEDVKTALMDRYASITRELEWLRKLIDLIPLVREESREAEVRA